MPRFCECGHGGSNHSKNGCKQCRDQSTIVKDKYYEEHGVGRFGLSKREREKYDKTNFPKWVKAQNFPALTERRVLNPCMRMKYSFDDITKTGLNVTHVSLVENMFGKDNDGKRLVSFSATGSREELIQFLQWLIQEDVNTLPLPNQVYSYDNKKKQWNRR